MTRSIGLFALGSLIAASCSSGGDLERQSATPTDETSQTDGSGVIEVDDTSAEAVASGGVPALEHSPVAVGQPSPRSDRSSVPAWSDPAAWPNGDVPASGDAVVIPEDRAVRLDDAVEVGSLDIEGQLFFDPTVPASLRSTGNVTVTGTLSMKPADASIDHSIEFVDVDESRFVGDSMQVVAEDVGLWVIGAGQMVLEGAPRRGWTNAVESIPEGSTTFEVVDATGWQVGDEVVVTPTAPPGEDGVGGGGRTGGFHRTTIEAVDGTAITVATPTQQAHPVVAGAYRPEVANLTRNVRIAGSDSGRAHIFIHAERPQFVRWVALNDLGVEQATGRYPLHFHHSGDGSYGSLVEGVVVDGGGHHAFVPHRSNGITLRDLVAFDIGGGAAYWWDFQEDSNDLLFEHVLSAGSDASGFFLGRGTNISLRDAVAVGVQNRHNAGGYEWENGSVGNWQIDGITAHNNQSAGIRVWQNADIPQVIDGFVAYHNHKYGIEHGAYSNRYVYRNLHLYGNALAGIWLQATSSPSPITFQNVEVESAGITEGSPIRIGGSSIPAELPALFHNLKVGETTSPVFSFEGGNPHQVTCSDCSWPEGIDLVEFLLPQNSANTWLDVADGTEVTRYQPDGSTLAITDPFPAAFGDGIGLLAEFFDQPDLTEPMHSTIVPSTSDGWSVEPDRPFAGIAPYHRMNVEDGSSMRWTGQIEIPATNAGPVEFATEYPGGVRLFLDDQLVIDAWDNEGLNGDFDDPFGAGRETATVELEPGLHSIVVESHLTPPQLDRYYGGYVSLYWQAGDGDRRVIPATQLYPPDGAVSSWEGPELGEIPS